MSQLLNGLIVVKIVKIRLNESIAKKFLTVDEYHSVERWLNSFTIDGNIEAFITSSEELAVKHFKNELKNRISHFSDNHEICKSVEFFIDVSKVENSKFFLPGNFIYGYSHSIMD